MCRNAPVRDPELPDGTDPSHSRQVCTGESDQPFCQLCPQSATYWRLSSPDGAANPWNGDGELTLADGVAPADVWDGVIDSKADGWYAVHWTKAEPCVLCLETTPMRSPKRKPCHKTCAEKYRAGERSFAQPR